MSAEQTLTLHELIVTVTKLAKSKNIEPGKVRIVDITKLRPGVTLKDLSITIVKDFIGETYSCMVKEKKWEPEKKPLSFI